MKKRNQRVTWITMGPAPHFATCQRCGQHIDTPLLPMPLRAFSKYAEYVLELHRYCEATS